ncbi:hypothetical protein RND81_04G232900 [Saponaria officinalis]|uniref:Neprosin PEP catalytic domain-containing protein n=1 Tax=Saponaria officinalis TaxID=3572 RepID=A0AAW1LPX8_SAPOF
MYKPSVQSNQWSSSRMKIGNGDDSIEVGFMVNPNFFKDDEVHLYTKISVGGKECINTQCSGFVPLNPNTPLGFILKNYTEPGAMQRQSMYLWVYKGKASENWWLSIIVNKRNYPIGYWPKTMFSSMAEFASWVSWGGEIYNPVGTEPKPEMGSGYKAQLTTAALFQNVIIVGVGDNLDIKSERIEKYENCIPFYTSLDKGYIDDNVGYVISFGGVKG